MQPQNNYYFRVHLLCLTAFGIRMIPIENKCMHFLYDVYAFFMVGMVIYVYTLLDGLSLIAILDDLAAFTFQLSYWVTHILGAVKTTVVIIKKDSILNLIQRIESGMFLPNTHRGGEKEISLVNEAIWYSIAQIVWFYVLVFMILGSRTVYVAIGNGIPIDTYDSNTNTTYVVYKRVTPYAFWSPFFDATLSPVYEIVSTYQMMSYYVQGFHIGAIDGLITGCMMHMRSQFIIIKETLNKLFTDHRALTNMSNYRANALPEDEANIVHQKIITCVKHHQTILQFCEEIEEEFKYLMLLQFVSSLLIICFGLFQLTVTEPKSMAFLSTICYMGLMTGQIFFYCYTGQLVWNASDVLSTDIFHSNWVVTKEESRRSILMMMIRAQRPTKFTAGKFTFLTLQTFVTVLRASFSYFMVLRQRNSIKQT